ncbi:sporulation protein YlmC with PRC-barrel domain [Nocardioides sp. BE266]|uniref:PRC-barrel domain-containing protein n=1 Tax=Nocardioides sp. BE266 TaxID=2817725 RepID=UPI0028678637|nr:PRC-barrel domain-containing protein [Nocardioides sp. BE266]MDR7255415.1 sporulation protein YlmC with PRC-barrel domain [Nocardioides sp. BE266]
MGDELLVLSDLVGAPARTPTGARVGRVADLTVTLGTTHPEVRRLLVRESRAAARLVPYDAVAVDPAGGVVTTDDGAPVDPGRPALEDAELLLWRDVVDTQVVDLHGHRLARVSDVVLRPAGTGLEVLGVDLGAAGLVRRLLPRAMRRGRTSAPLGWDHLHLTSPRGHAVQLTADDAGFRSLDARGLAHLLGRLTTDAGADVIRAVEPAHAVAALHHAHPSTALHLVRALRHDERRRLTEAATGEHAQTLDRLGHAASAPLPRRLRRTRGWRVHRPPEEHA